MTMEWKILFFGAIVFYKTGICSERMKRHLVFTEGSRLFLSIDIKENSLQYSNLFAEATGYKVVWDLPNRYTSSSRNGRIYRRDICHGLENLFNQFAVNRSACIRKSRYEPGLYLHRYDQFLRQLYDIIFGAHNTFVSTKAVLPKSNINHLDEDIHYF